MLTINIKDYNTGNLIKTYLKTYVPNTNTLVIDNVLYVVIESTTDLHNDVIDIYVVVDKPLSKRYLSQLSLRHFLADERH